MPERWRQGRRVPNHVYAQEGDQPADADRWVGSFPDPADARRAVEAVSAPPVGCEHLDGPYRRLLDEREALRSVLARLVQLCDDEYAPDWTPTWDEARRVLAREAARDD